MNPDSIINELKKVKPRTYNYITLNTIKKEKNKKNIIRIPELDEIIKKNKVKVEGRNVDTACFDPNINKIIMPYKCLFKNCQKKSREEQYMRILAHELIHWTAHGRRLNRKTFRIGTSRNDTEIGQYNYAIEEITADIGSYMLLKKLGFDIKLDDLYLSYIKLYLEDIKDKRKHRAIIRSSIKDARQAVKYLLRYKNV